jgi:hypothetical protein
MLRLETETGYWLITHPDHAHLAGAFAERWGNARFASPTPRASVLHGIHVHDDGWVARDAQPCVTRQGKPSAFSSELVGKYSAFEEIDLADYLAVRERAVAQVEAVDPYAALLVSMHTQDLLTTRADRSTIAPDQLPLLDDFLWRLSGVQHSLRNNIESRQQYSREEVTNEAIRGNFRLLQACDNLSLLSCVAYMRPATLLHPHKLVDGSYTEVTVEPVAPRHFRLSPYPFDRANFTLTVPARHVEGHLFATSGELAEKFAAAPVQSLEIAISR